MFQLLLSILIVSSVRAETRKPISNKCWRLDARFIFWRIPKQIKKLDNFIRFETFLTRK